MTLYVNFKQKTFALYRLLHSCFVNILHPSPKNILNCTKFWFFIHNSKNRNILNYPNLHTWLSKSNCWTIFRAEIKNNKAFFHYRLSFCLEIYIFMEVVNVMGLVFFIFDFSNYLVILFDTNFYSFKFLFINSIIFIIF